MARAHSTAKGAPAPFHLVLADLEDATAFRVCQSLAAQGQRVEVVTPEELFMAPHWSHDPLGDSRVELASGVVIDDRSVLSVFNRVRFVVPLQFTRASAVNQSYAAEELFALLSSWLSGFGGRVVNRPHPGNIAGFRALSPVEDRLRLGAPVRASSRARHLGQITGVTGYPDGEAVLGGPGIAHAPAATRVLVAGDHGDVPAAARAEMAYRGLTIAHVDLSDTGEVLGLDPLPHAPEQADAIAAHLIATAAAPPRSAPAMAKARTTARRSGPIVLLGIPSESPAALIRDAAEAQGIETITLNPREAAHADLTLSEGRVTLHRAGELLDLTEAPGIYTRLGTAEHLPDYRTGDAIAKARISAWHGLVNDWLETTPARVLNRIKACNSNMSKPFQAQIIADCGVDTPETLITNDPDTARAFRDRWGEVIFKSISANRSIVRKLAGPYATRLDRIRALPVQFQRCIEGTDIRVHVIGSELFATQINSDAEDYRYGGDAQYEPTDLPADLSAACLRLSDRLDLPLCGIDLRRTPSGRYVCFEVNPSPAYSCYEEITGQPIAAAIARWLATGQAAEPKVTA